MKKIILIVSIMILGTLSVYSQSYGYVTVSWNDQCEECCAGMGYQVCITVVRVSDNYVVTENLCATEDGDTFEHDFSFPMPSCTENEEFIVYAAVRGGCLPSTICCYEKNPGVTGTCAQLLGDTFPDVVVNF